MLPFEIKPLGVRGRMVRFGGVLDQILDRHDYPMPASAVLAEVVTLAAMFGSMLPDNVAVSLNVARTSTVKPLFHISPGQKDDDHISVYRLIRPNPKIG